MRLYQGDFNQVTVFSADPVEVACRWQEMGAPRLHLVDLDGAAQGQPVNLDVIQKIAMSVKLPLQVGGGIRKLETIYRLLSLGIGRVVLGTAAVAEPSLVAEACHRFGEAIVVGVDVREGIVASHGWQESTGSTAAGLMSSMAALGVRRFIYTDIARDGTLTEPNFEAIGQLVKHTPLPIIASGGISSVDHLTKLSQLGVEGAIVGRALYTGDIDLKEALRVISGM